MANKLMGEQSLYLQQHAHNPVDWYPWGDEAFELAKKENKPVIVSIGYAACHWCHVMEHESFEDAVTAAYMNEHFINIKVDREEHPDVDQMYMDAVQAISGSGGWPLNVFVTPDKIPFYGGTYYPPQPAYSRPSWMQLMQRMTEIWTQRPEEIQAQSEQMLTFLKNASRIGFKPGNIVWEKKNADEIAENLLRHADKKQGGFGNAPKFPQTMAIQYLLEHYHYTKHEASLQQALLSLDKMMEGGIYDQLGGGFARYSTDADWLAPHFEKMLYDNALLLKVYCTAYRLTKQSKYKTVIEETITFAERELKDESGIYYSALDADSEGIEGKFYTWTWDEWNAVFKEEEDMLKDYFGVKELGNWEHTNILHVALNINEIAAKRGISKEVVEQRIAEGKKRLLAWREKKIRPATDDKSLLSWNALMNTALVDAGIALSDMQYLDRAREHMNLLLANFTENGSLRHVWKQGKARIDASLEDYATLIQALLQLGSATGDATCILEANRYAETVMHDFLQEDGVLFYYSAAHSKNVPVRKIDLYDGALPSANALMAYNLSVLGRCMGRNMWIEQSDQMLQQLHQAAAKHSLSFAFWSLQMQRAAYGLKTVLLTGEERTAFKIEFDKVLLPHTFIFSTTGEAEIPLTADKKNRKESFIFVCTEDACYPPVSDVSQAIDLI
ncbi:MAG TPA: thioredoxin domain-containing protein [Flavipsychrobacter sp.]|nr:thioredoxin domain-containing protein [Flavipsychrobacter sp.]